VAVIAVAVMPVAVTVLVVAAGRFAANPCHFAEKWVVNDEGRRCAEEPGKRHPAGPAGGTGGATCPRYLRIEEAEDAVRDPGFGSEPGLWGNGNCPEDRTSAGLVATSTSP